MYKDLDKRRETTRERVRRYRALQKGVTDKVEVNVTPVIPVTPKVIEQGQRLVRDLVGETMVRQAMTQMNDSQVVIKDGRATMSSPRPDHSPTCKCIVCSLKR